MSETKIKNPVLGNKERSELRRVIIESDMGGRQEFVKHKEDFILKPTVT